MEAEQINPITKTLGEDYIEDTKKGITTLLKADQKLADIIADLCNLSYENANYELFLSSLILKERNENLSPVKFTIDRIKNNTVG